MAEATGLRQSLPYPVYGAPFGFVIPITEADGDLVTSAAGLDSEISKNGDTLTDCTNEATEIGGGLYYLLLTATEMTADVVSGVTKTSTADAKTTSWSLYPRKLVTVRSGTAAGGDTGYITLDASASAVDDYYNGMVCIATIDSTVEARVITDYTGSNKQAAVTPAWNTAPDSDDTFVIKLPEGVQLPNVVISGTKNTLDSLSGADGDTLKDLSDEIAAIAVGAGLTAQEVRDAMKLAPTAGAPAAGSVDAHLDDILEDTGTTLDGLIDAIKAKTDALDVTGTPAVVSLVDGGDLTVIAGATFDPPAITGLTIAATWTSAYFTVKTKKEGSGLLLAADSSAVIQIRVSNPGTAGDGLLYLNGAAASSAAYGSLALDAGAGTATIVLADDATVLLAKKAGLFWDVKVLAADGTSDVVCSGSLDVVLTPTKTV